jgi:hypothetical protein
MEKSINLVIEDLRDDILGIIGKYRIPIVIMNMVIQEIARSMADATKTAIVNDKKVYEEGLKNENSDCK